MQLRLWIAALLFAAGSMAACRPTSASWAPSLGSGLPERGTARWVVVAWMADWQCSACRGELESQLRYVATKYPDELELVWMLPAGYLRPRLGTPGRVEEAPERRVQEENGHSPLPRIEVWSRGRLLLLRSLPPSLPQVRGVAAEIEWTRAFTDEG